MTERMIEVDGLELCAESFGDAADPPLLMIMGATASKGWWPDAMMRRLAEGGRFVLRYDHRDTGRSTSGAPGGPDYAIDDLADDALRVLDAYGLASAHVVGMSLGGLLAQILALRDPRRVRTLTLIASEIHGDPDFVPEPIAPEIIAHFMSSASLDWADEEAATGFVARLWSLNAARGRPLSPLVVETARHEYRRARSPASMLNHTMLAGGKAWRNRAAEIARPLLVVHGRLDPVVDHRHGEMLARMVPDARLLTLEEAGHELREADWTAIVSAILSHTA